MKKAGVPDPAHEAEWLKRIEGSGRIIDTSTLKEADEAAGIFLAHAFSAILGEDGRIDTNVQERMVALLTSLRAEGYGVHCSLDREDWGAKLMSPETALLLDQDQVGKADMLVSFPQGSPGAFMELGMRAAISKPAMMVKTEAPANEDPAINAEELMLMETIVNVLEASGVACTMIEDHTTDVAGFESSVVPEIVGWVGQNI